MASGAVGGNFAGSLFKRIAMNTRGNALAGLVGGMIGAQILEREIGLAPAVATGAGPIDAGAIVAEIAGGGVGGAVMMVLVGLLRGALAR